MNKTVLITGANRGIGLGFVEEYLKIGFYVIATCRNPNLSIELHHLSKQHPEKLILEKLDVNKQSDLKN